MNATPVNRTAASFHDDDVKRFQAIYKAAYGEEMPIEEARMWLIRLVRLYRVLAQPTPGEIAERLAKSAAAAMVDVLPATAPAERQEIPPAST